MIGVTVVLAHETLERRERFQSKIDGIPFDHLLSGSFRVLRVFRGLKKGEA
jgi:hypothetical protein